jgi:hypothetical protein
VVVAAITGIASTVERGSEARLILLILVVLWFFGGLHINRP